MSTREELRDKLRQKLNETPDARIDAANKHLEAWDLARRITGYESKSEDEAYGSFLSGWDAAMETSQPDLFKELQTVRAKLDELVCERFEADQGGVHWRIFRTADDPEANGRNPQYDETRWTATLPLEDGSFLKIHMGKKGRDTLFGMLIADCADSGEQEPTDA